MYSTVEQTVGSNCVYFKKGGYSVYVDEEFLDDEEAFPASTRYVEHFYEQLHEFDGYDLAQYEGLCDGSTDNFYTM